MVKLFLINRSVIVLLLMSVTIHLASSVVSAARKVDFNEPNIVWRDYRDGMAMAKSRHKAVLMIIYTDW